MDSSFKPFRPSDIAEGYRYNTEKELRMKIEVELLRYVYYEDNFRSEVTSEEIIRPNLSESLWHLLQLYVRTIKFEFPRNY